MNYRMIKTSYTLIQSNCFIKRSYSNIFYNVFFQIARLSNFLDFFYSIVFKCFKQRICVIRKVRAFGAL
jgi:hypothetical protein